jgi:hypothetical protein
VCLRGDTDFSLTAHLDRWADRVDFVFGMDANATLTRIADGLDASAWQRLHRPPAYQPRTGKRRSRRANTKRQIVIEREYLNLKLNHEDVAVFDYQPRKCARPYRVVALRKNISRSRGEHALFDEIRYFFSITSYTDKPQPRSSPWPTSAATRKTSSANSNPASTPCGCRSTTSSPTGPTCSSPPKHGTSKPGSP